MCAEQRDVWQPIPKERINFGAFYHPDPGRRGTVGRLSVSGDQSPLADTLKSQMYKVGHFLKDNPGLFDATFFNVTGTEARVRRCKIST